MAKIKRVLFLCSGNTCRSPFAEYFSKWLQDVKYVDELKDIRFDSAGLYHYYDTPQEGTINYLNSKGIDISDFRSKVVDDKLINSQNLILGFEKKFHIDKLKRKFKHLENLDEKVFLLLEYAGEKKNLDIIDPFDLDEVEYNKILKKIEVALHRVVEKIIEQNKKQPL